MSISYKIRNKKSTQTEKQKKNILLIARGAMTPSKYISCQTISETQRKWRRRKWRKFIEDVQLG